MKLSLFTAALIGVVGFQNTQAVHLEVENHDFDFLQAFAQAEAEAEGQGKALTDAECEETVNGVTLRL